MTSHLAEALPELRRAMGVDLSGYRRDTLERRFAARMAKLGIGDPAMTNDRRRLRGCKS